MEIYLPIAELPVNVFTVLGMGAAVGFISGLFGVGGGFLLTPLLIFSGIPHPVAVATVTPQIVASSASGALSYWRKRLIDVKLALCLFGAGSVNWLGQPDTALWAIMAVTVWKEAGFFMIFYLAALQTIPPELKEAARIEGAGRWTYTRRIVLPLLMPTTLFVLVNALINSVRLIDHLFILTKGGPDNASKLILYWIWEMAFSYFDAPHAAAMTVLVLVVLGIVASIQFGVIDRKAHYR